MKQQNEYMVTMQVSVSLYASNKKEAEESARHCILTADNGWADLAVGIGKKIKVEKLEGLY